MLFHRCVVPKCVPQYRKNYNRYTNGDKERVAKKLHSPLVLSFEKTITDMQGNDIRKTFIYELLVVDGGLVSNNNFFSKIDPRVEI